MVCAIMLRIAALDPSAHDFSSQAQPLVVS